MNSTEARMALEDAVTNGLDAGLDKSDIDDTVASAIESWEIDNGVTAS